MRELRATYTAGIQAQTLHVGGRGGRCPNYRTAPPKKSLSGRQFTGKNSPRPAAARAGRIFTGKLSAEGDFSGGDPVTGRDCLWDGQYFDKRKTYQFCDCLSTDGFFMGQTF